MEKHDIDWLRLSDYVSGRASSETRAAIEQWMAVDPARRQFVESVEQIWARSGVLREPVGPIDAGATWRAFAPRLDASPAVRRPARRSMGIPLRSRSASWVSVGLAAGIIIVGGAILARRTASPPTGRAVVARTMRVLHTERGQRADLQLTDGTRVILGVESKLQWPTQFAEDGAGARDVYLEGEAYFDVQHDSTRPFRVHTLGVVTEDVGTAFAIRSYREDPQVAVAVQAGSVALLPSGAPASRRTVLSAGDLAIATVGRPEALEVRHHADLDQLLAFTQGSVRFVDTPLPKVLTELRRWYDLDITPMDSTLARARVTMTVAGDNPSALLRALAAALDARFEQQGRTVRLYARR